MTQPSDANGSQNPERDMTDEELEEVLRKLSAAYPKYVQGLAQEMRSWADDDRGGVPDDKRGWVQEFLEGMEQGRWNRADENSGGIPSYHPHDNRRGVPGDRARQSRDNRGGVPGDRARQSRDNRNGIPSYHPHDNRTASRDDNSGGVPSFRPPDNRGRVLGYRVRESPRDNRGEGPSENSGGAADNPGGVPAYRVREPDGTWHLGGKDGHIWGPGCVLWSGEPPPGPGQGENTPRQPTVVQRREAAANAAKRRRDAELAERTDNDRGLGR